MLEVSYDDRTSKELTCDMCDSLEIIETREGYVCRVCSIVLENKKLEYYRPYNKDTIQYAVLGTTQIGSVRERFQYMNSDRLNSMNKLQSIKNNDELVLEEAKIEISRIFNCLDYPGTLKEAVFQIFKKIRSGLRPGTKYRSPQNLVPLSIYYSLKLLNISINEVELLGVSKISKKDFNAFKLQIRKYLPQYDDRNRKDYILQKVFELSEHFQLGLLFYYQSKRILYKLWEGIKNTKDDVIAGLIASISVLCSFKERVTVSSICNKIGIKMSTIQTQVKKKIFDKFKISGFTTLIKSSNILEKVMKRIEVIEQEHKIITEVDEKSSEIAPEIIEIKLGNVNQVSNNFNKIEYNFYAIKLNNNYSLIVSLKSYNSKEIIRIRNSKRNYSTNNSKDKLFDLKLLRYKSSKGPPNLMSCVS